MKNLSAHNLNIAATCIGTHALGPGLRSVVWTQGCPFRCEGCLSPQWIPIIPARQITPEALVAELLSDPAVTGITLSGGEPFLQAAGLAEMLKLARQSRDIDVICFTGYLRSQLEQMSKRSPSHALLSQLDVLIDGPYIQEMNDNLGMRGSSNQTIHFLTNRLLGFDFETTPRQSEILVRDGEMLFVGVPPRGVISSVIQGLDAFPPRRLTRTEHERS
jgi:anaerobic ribonucleoside-triphosphate reductase activating protein